MKVGKANHSHSASAEPTAMNSVDKPEVFVPTYKYYEVLSKKIAPHYIMENVFSRFPFQQPFAAYHPALDADYLIEKAMKGKTFFLSESYRDEKQFFRIMSERAQSRAVLDRSDLILQTDRRSADDFWDHILLMQKLNSIDLYEMRAKRSDEARNLFIDLLKEAFYKHQEFLEINLEIRDELIDKYYHQFWDAVYKNLDIEPRPLPLTGISIAELTKAIRYNENSSAQISAIRLIRKNVDLYRADALAARSSGEGGNLPASIFALTFRQFHKASYEKELRLEMGRENSQKQMDEMIALRDDYNRKVMQYREDFVTKDIDEAEIFWRLHFKAHEKLRLIVPASSTNTEAILRTLKYRESPVFLMALNNIKENLLKARANQIIDNGDSFLPEMRFMAKLLFDHGEWVKQKITENLEHTREVIQEIMHKNRVHENELFWKQRKSLIAHDKDIVDFYWSEFDKNHGLLRFPLNFIGLNETELRDSRMRDHGGRVGYAQSVMKRLKGLFDPYTLMTKNKTTHLSLHGGYDDWLSHFPAPTLAPKEKQGLDFLPHDNPQDSFKIYTMWTPERDLVYNFTIAHDFYTEDRLNAAPQEVSAIKPEFSRAAFHLRHETNIWVDENPQQFKKADISKVESERLWDFEQGEVGKKIPLPIMKKDFAYFRSPTDAVDYKKVFRSQSKSDTNASLVATEQKHIAQYEMNAQNSLNIMYQNQVDYPVKLKNVLEREGGPLQEESYVKELMPFLGHTSIPKLVKELKTQFIPQNEPKAAIDQAAVNWELEPPEQRKMQKKNIKSK